MPENLHRVNHTLKNLRNLSLAVTLLIRYIPATSAGVLNAGPINITGVPILAAISGLPTNSWFTAIYQDTHQAHVREMVWKNSTCNIYENTYIR